MSHRTFTQSLCWARECLCRYFFYIVEKILNGTMYAYIKNHHIKICWCREFRGEWKRVGKRIESAALNPLSWRKYIYKFADCGAMKRNHMYCTLYKYISVCAMMSKTVAHTIFRVNFVVSFALLLLHFNHATVVAFARAKYARASQNVCNFLQFFFRIRCLKMFTMSEWESDII